MSKNKNDDFTNDWVGVDESITPPKPARSPLLIEDKDTIARISEQHDKDMIVFKLVKYAEMAVEDEKPQYNSAISALLGVARIKGLIDKKVDLNVTTETYEDLLKKAKNAE